MASLAFDKCPLPAAWWVAGRIKKHIVFRVPIGILGFDKSSTDVDLRKDVICMDFPKFCLFVT